MNDLPRQKLRELVAQHRHAILDDPQRCEAMLQDRCGEHQREVLVLVRALEEGVVADLLATRGSSPPEALLTRLTRRLQEDLSLSEDVARWAVESWALALGVLPGAEPVPVQALTVPTLIVSQQEEGHLHTLNAAVRNTPPGARILVRPGLYNEALFIDKPLEIIGDGLAADIIIESAESCCIVMQTDHALLRGLTIRSQVGLKGNKYYAIDIPRGQLEVEDCDITSDTFACVAIHGPTANPIIRRCRIHDGEGVGVSIYEGGRGVLEDCNIVGNKYAGVEICEDSTLVLRHCQVHNNRGDGIWAYHSAQATVEDCLVFDNARAGIRIQEGCDLTIRGGLVQDPVVTYKADRNISRRWVIGSAIIGAIVLGAIGKGLLGALLGAILGAMIGAIIAGTISGLLGQASQ